eukprot:scaffold533_cov369-Prasinococcus_capsulatus_cf.AAC.6
MLRVVNPNDNELEDSDFGRVGHGCMCRPQPKGQPWCMCLLVVGLHGDGYTVRAVVHAVTVSLDCTQAAATAPCCRHSEHHAGL